MMILNRLLLMRMGSRMKTQRYLDLGVSWLQRLCLGSRNDCDEDLKVIEYKNGLDKFPDKDLVEEAGVLGLLDGGEDDSSVLDGDLV